MELREFLKLNLEKRNAELDEIKARLEALEKINDESENEEELKAAGEELDVLMAKKAELEKELEEINTQIAYLDKPVEEDKPQRNINFMKREERTNMNREELELRAKEFKENARNTVELRSTTIAGGKVATPTSVDGIVDAFSGVSSIVDLVKVENCHGMGSNKVAYVKTGAVAAAQTEGQAITGTEATFDFVTIQPTSYGVLSYVTAQVKKQSPLDYEGKIKKLSMDALKAKMGEVITTKVKASTLTTTVNAAVASSKGVINEKTLRNLVLGYGGAYGAEGPAWLVLNKTDLIAFGDVRGTNEKKAVYEIMPNASNPNVGQIKDGGLTVNYCLDPNVTACNGTAQTSTAQKTMYYGNPKNIELDLFGDYEIAVSDDYKFAENMLAIRGTADAGADVIKKDGIVFLTIPATGTAG